MATAREVQNTLSRFNTQIDRATHEIQDLVQLIRQLEKEVEEFNADEDLDVTRGIKRDVNRSKDAIGDLRTAIEKLEREISDTNRKLSSLAR